MFAPVNIAVVGHSYVRRLRDFSTRLPFIPDFAHVAPPLPRPNLLDLDNCQVSWHFIGGGTVPLLNTSNQIAIELQQALPAIVFLQIGSNDLDQIDVDPFTVAYEVSELADKMLNVYGAQRVFVGQLIPRYQTRHCPVEIYNQRVFLANGYLMNFCQRQGPISFQVHRGLSNSLHCIHDQNDWVHLNDLGHFKLYRSVRAAARHALSHL